MAEAIDAMRSAFIQLSNGDAYVPKRLSLEIPDKNATSLVMPAYAKGSAYYAVKIVSVNNSNPEKGLPLIHAIVQVFDASNGNHVATMDGGSITAIRTAAASGLATDLLAKKNVKICAIFGTGVQAASHAQAMMEVRDLEKIIVFSRRDESAQLFCDLFSSDLKCEIGEIDALNEADIICTTTPAEFPLFEFEDIKSGSHLNVVGSHQPKYREVTTELVVNSKVVVDEKESCNLEAGDLIIPYNEGKWSFDKVHGELGGIASGKIPGRELENEITLFKSVGNAIQDLAMANLIMRKLKHD